MGSGKEVKFLRCMFSNEVDVGFPSENLALVSIISIIASPIQGCQFGNLDTKFDNYGTLCTCWQQKNQDLATLVNFQLATLHYLLLV